MMFADGLLILTWFFGISMLNWFAATLWFARLSVRYIDSELERRGIDKPVWDGIGIRIGIYALAILSKKFAQTPLVAGAEIRAMVRKKDFYLAIWFEISLVVVIAATIALYPFIPE